VHLPRLPIPVMAPKRSASASPEPSTQMGRPCAACWAVHVLALRRRRRSLEPAPSSLRLTLPLVVASASVSESRFAGRWGPRLPGRATQQTPALAITTSVTSCDCVGHGASACVGRVKGRPLGRVAHRGPPTATFPAPASFTVNSAANRQPGGPAARQRRPRGRVHYAQLTLSVSHPRACSSARSSVVVDGSAVSMPQCWCT
jgi:hypothetical protein